MLDLVRRRTPFQIKGWLHTQHAYLYERLRGASGKRRFVLFTAGRSGSHLLIDLLNSHPEIKCLLEGHIFRRGPRVREPLRYLNGLAAISARPVFGCKLTPRHATRHQLDVTRLAGELADDGWRFVLLSRRNLLRQAVSGIIAIKRGVYHDRTPPPVHAMRVSVEPRSLLDRLARLEAQRRRLADWVAPYPHEHLVYEEDLEHPSDQQAAIARILQRLDVAPHTVSTSLVKSGRSSLAESVENFHEMAQALQGTQYERYLAS